MKKFLAIAIFGLALSLTPKLSNAQAVVQWPSGPQTVASVTATTKVPAYSITPTNTSYLINITVDTSLVISFTNIKVKAGSIVYVKVTNGGTAAARTVTGNTKCVMASFSLTSAKIHMLEFVYDGTNYINTSKFLVN